MTAYGLTRNFGFYLGRLNPPACWFSVFVGLLLLCPVKAAEDPLVLPIWPGAVPGDYGTIGPERRACPF